MAEAASLPDDGLTCNLPARLGVAVSGGGDSVALLLLTAVRARALGSTLSVVTVDHRLRAESADEAAWVANLCKTLELPHTTLVWQDWDGAGNTQKAARDARYGMMSAWAAKNDLGAIALGHTLDDQAETVLMRLARGAGVDGLSAMAFETQLWGATWLRPLLMHRRVDLRSFLKANGQEWLDDPSNENPESERVKARKIMSSLVPLGIDASSLADVARNMQASRDALRFQTRRLAEDMTAVRGGGLDVDLTQFERLPSDFKRRFVNDAVAWLATSQYPPRGKSVRAALSQLRSNGNATLNGCRFQIKGAHLWIYREYSAVRDLCVDAHEVWDGRWRFIGKDPDQRMRIRALGDAGLSQCKDWRASGLPRGLLLSSPALWLGDKLVSAPLAEKPHGWGLNCEKTDASFFEAIFSH